MAQFDEIFNPETGQTMVEYNGQWVDKPEGYKNPEELAAEQSPLEAGLITGGKAIADLGRGVESLFYKATGNEQGEQNLADEYIAEQRYITPLEEQNPISTGLGYAAPNIAAAFLPGGLAAQAAMQGTIGAATYDLNSAWDNGVTDAMLTGAGYVANNAATRIFKLIGTPMLQSAMQTAGKVSARAKNKSTAMKAAATRARNVTAKTTQKNLDALKEAGKSGFIPAGLELANQVKAPLGKALTTPSLQGNIAGVGTNMFGTPFSGYEPAYQGIDGPVLPTGVTASDNPEASLNPILSDMQNVPGLNDFSYADNLVKPDAAFEDNGTRNALTPSLLEPLDLNLIPYMGKKKSIGPRG